MWKINEVLSFDDVRYRILHIHQSEIIWINIDENKGIPKLVLHLQLIEWMDNGRLVRSQDPYAYLIHEEPLVDSAAFKKREHAYQVISPVIPEFKSEVRHSPI